VRWCRLGNDVSQVNDELKTPAHLLFSEIKSLKDAVDKLIDNLRQLTEEVDKIKDEMIEIKKKVGELEDDLKKTSQELSEQINKVKHKVIKVEKRVKEAEENLNNHLFQQDKVLEHNSEVLLNNLVMQYVLNIVDRVAPSSHIILGYLNEKPFIVIETTEDIQLILISTEVLMEDIETLNKIRDVLSEYTDKEVKYNILTTSVTKSETPAWLYSLHEIH
jgi:chromosome segregation ATPase